MGYRSDIRLKLETKDFKQLKTIVKDTSLEEFDICKNIKDVIYYGDKYYEEDIVYCGWDYIKWYDDFQEVKQIKDFLQKLYAYAFARFGEDITDIERTAKNMDDIYIKRSFVDDE